MTAEIEETKAEIVGVIKVRYIDGTSGEIGVSTSKNLVGIRYTGPGKDTLLLLPFAAAQSLVELLSVAIEPDDE